MCSRTSARYCSRSASGTTGHLLAALEILEARRVVEREVDLRRIEHVKQDDVVAAEADQADARRALRRGSS